MTAIKLAAVILITIVIVAAFVTAPPLASMADGAASRIFYFHVPSAWIAPPGSTNRLPARKSTGCSRAVGRITPPC